MNTLDVSPGTTAGTVEQAAIGSVAEQDTRRLRPTGLDTFVTGRDHLRDNRRTVLLVLIVLLLGFCKFMGYW